MTKIESYRLSVRNAETVSAHLNAKGKGRITIAICRNQTAIKVAKLYLGSNATDKQIKTLALEIFDILGIKSE